MIDPGHDPALEARAAEDAAGLRFLPGELEWLGIDDLEPHPRNANEGDLGAISERVDQLGFYGTVLVQRREDGPHRILAGEHRWLTLRAKGARRVPCWVLDVDDDTALRIMVGDNETTRRGRDDPQLAVENLTTLAATDLGLAGSAFDLDDLEQLRADADRTLRASLASQAPPPPDEQHGRMGVHADCPKCGHRFPLGSA